MADTTIRAPRSWPLVGILPGLRRAPHTAFAAVQARDGDHARVRVGPRQVHVLGDPETCRALLRQPEAAVGKSFFYEILKSAFGEGLLTSGGDHWQRQRALIQPLLTPKAVRRYVPTIAQVTAELVAAWRAAGRDGTPVDAAAWSGWLAREVTVRALFGEDGGSAGSEVADALAVMERWSAQRFWSLLDPERYPNPARARYRRAVAAIDRRIYPMIDRRQADPAARDDLLTRLVQAAGPEGTMSRQELRDEAATLYLAGQETTANALSFTLWELARRPELQATLRAEARAVLGDGAPPADAARQLPWTRAAVEEALRLHPPVWSVGRQTHQALELNGTQLPAGSTCMVAPWILHRRADVWHDPARFDAGRFHSGHQPRAFMPFGAGHRACVGRDFAMQELILALALILRDLALADATGAPVRDRALVGLVPDPAPRLRVRAID
jgi:cytochrome P450